MTSTDIVPTTADWETAELLPTIRHMCANGATDPEFKILVATARLLGLNPMLKQIWCVKNLNKPELPAQIYASRDGFLAIAHRSGQFDGMQSGVKTDDAGQEIGWCRIWRRDMSHPFEVEIKRSEYDTGKSLWQSKPQTMTVKVAEAHCLRRAFDICGVYTPDEMPEQDHGPRLMHGAPSTIAEVVQPTNSSQIDTSAPVLRCDVCGRSNGDYPDLPIRERDGKMICGPCQRKAEKEMHVPSPAEPAPAPVKAVPKPAAKVPAPSSEAVAVCEECGAPVTDAQRKTSMLFVSRVLCAKCIDQVNGPQPGEQGFA
ncbi:MAG: phage recombination protein Bet [Bacilli bacterium]